MYLDTNSYKRVCGVLCVIFLILLSGSVAGATGNNAKQARPNILFILTDNQAASLIGAYGNPDIETPHIDRLAREGILFTEAFAVNGMCSPTRATLMTGLMPSQHGVHNWLDDDKMDEWPRDWSAVAEYRTLPYTLREHGYQTAMIGKWHLGQPWEPSLGYEYWLTFTSGHTVDFWHNMVVDNGKTYEVSDRHIVDFFTEKAVAYIDNYDGAEPFYLQLNYDGPYVNPPTNMGPARNRYFKEYQDRQFESFPREAVNQNLIDQLVDLASSGRRDDFWSKILQMVLRMNGDHDTMANIASQNTLVDDGVGRVLAALERNGLDENTLIVFSSDQGNFYGQHGLWTHTIVTMPSNLYEDAMRVPLIFRHKGRLTPSRQSDRLIGQYDIPQTILDYVGLGDVELGASPGESFVPHLKGKEQEWKDTVFYEQEETRGIRTRAFAYWKRLNGTGEAELYDIQRDPGQHNNLYGKQDYNRIAEQLDKELDRFFTRYSNPEFDLWRGGVAKGSVQRPEMFQSLYGESWKAVAEVKAPFQAE